jgi:PIN domain nuclease of toxin-antitoxin system
MTLPRTFPMDPADRLIAGTAAAEGLALVTADKAIREAVRWKASGE